MSEFMKDSGHRMMQTCDSCGGAFHTGAPQTEDESAPDWTCETCTSNEATIKALADALEAAKAAMWRGEFGPKGRDRDVPAQVDAALRLARRLP